MNPKQNKKRKNLNFDQHKTQKLKFENMNIGSQKNLGKHQDFDRIASEIKYLKCSKKASFFVNLLHRVR